MKLLEFKLFVLEPTLEFMGMYSLAAERLMLGTIAHESQGQHLDQRLGKDDTVLGPAFGIYQIEVATHDDIFENFLNLSRWNKIKDKVMQLASLHPSQHVQLATNLCYATAIARCIYYRRPEPLPAPDNIDGIWMYYKQWFNTPLGAANKEDWMTWYARLVMPLYERNER